jgi:hypothetical protein
LNGLEVVRGKEKGNSRENGAIVVVLRHYQDSLEKSMHWRFRRRKARLRRSAWFKGWRACIF